jgi:hypothetical protein
MEGRRARCYCGSELDDTTCTNHLLRCTMWRQHSPLYHFVRDLYLQNMNNLTSIRYELSALIYEEFALPQPIISSSVPHFINGRQGFSPPRRRQESPVHIKIPEEEAKGRDCDLVFCEMCGHAKPDMRYMTMPDCGHIICTDHMIPRIMRRLPKKGAVRCIMKGCRYYLSVLEIKSLIGDDEYNRLTNPNPVVPDDVIIVECTCGCAGLIEPGEPNYNTKDSTGKTISRTAAEHMARNRYRCPKCEKILCANCKSEPYHLGYTCEEYAKFKSSAHCRYCDRVIPGGRVACEDPSCQERLAMSCSNVLKCGHKCYGVRNEPMCPPCMSDECSSKGPFSEHDYCTICFTEGLGSAPAIILTCSHSLHYHCIIESLEKRWVGPRITFKFAKCPQCSAWIDAPYNPIISSKMREIRNLYDDIREKALKRLKFEGMENDARLNNPHDQNYYRQPERYALDRFSYYECYNCKHPYFGGKKECEQNQDREQYDPKELVCPSCAAEGQEGTDCPRHGKDFIEFKCRFCCSIAAWYCWGTTHFCEGCHTKQNNGDYLNRKPREQLPKCPGKEECPLKVRHPPNGDEFALGCAVCRNLALNKQDF